MKCTRALIFQIFLLCPYTCALDKGASRPISVLATLSARVGSIEGICPWPLPFSSLALSLARTPASLSSGISLKLNYFLNMCLSSQSPHTSTRALQAPPHAHARTHIRAHPRTPAHTHTHVRTHTHTFKHAHADNCLGASCARMCSLTRMCFLTSMCSLTHADNRLGGWYSYRISKAAQNQFTRTASIELKRSLLRA